LRHFNEFEKVETRFILANINRMILLVPVFCKKCSVSPCVMLTRVKQAFQCSGHSQSSTQWARNGRQYIEDLNYSINIAWCYGKREYKRKSDEM